MKLKSRILQYETWISSDFKSKEPEVYQRELHKLYSENIDAFFFYRNWLFTLTLDIEERDVLNELNSILDFKIGTSQHQELLRHFLDNDSSEVFSKKRLNTFEISLQSSNLKLNHNHCFLYQQYYEIEIIFVVLYSFFNLNKNNTIETSINNFRDKSGAIKKGMLINNIKSKLKDYPLISKLFDIAYNPKIRNVIGHNNYRIDGDKIFSLENETIKISGDELLTAICSMQSINNYLLHYFSSKSILKENLKNCGVLGIAFGLEGSRPVLQIFQLSCFYNLGSFTWGKKIVFSINTEHIDTNFGIHASIIGNLTKELDQLWFKPLMKTKKLRIYLSAIVPRDEQINFITLDDGDFIVTSDQEKIELDFEIVRFDI